MTKHLHPNCEGECACEPNSECPDPCPTIVMFRQKPDDPCRIQWAIETCGDKSTLLVQIWDVAQGPTTRQRVEANGEMSVPPNTDYTINAAYPGCPDVEQTIHVDDTCPCQQGCSDSGGVAGRGFVEGNPITATVIVSGFRNLVRVTYPYAQAIVSSSCQVTLYEDLTLLNHTATFAIRTFQYTNDDDRECILHYIPPVEYYLGRVTTKVRAENDLGFPISVPVIEEGDATFDFYGVIPGGLYSPGHGDSVMIDTGFRLKIVRVSSNPILQSEACKIASDNVFKPDLYAPYDGGDQFGGTYPFFADCWIFRHYPGEVRLTIWPPFSGGETTFPPWCIYDGPWNGYGKPWLPDDTTHDPIWNISFQGNAILFGSSTNVGKILWKLNVTKPNLPNPVVP